MTRRAASSPTFCILLRTKAFVYLIGAGLSLHQVPKKGPWWRARHLVQKEWLPRISTGTYLHSAILLIVGVIGALQRMSPYEDGAVSASNRHGKATVGREPRAGHFPRMSGKSPVKSPGSKRWVVMQPQPTRRIA